MINNVFNYNMIFTPIFNINIINRYIYTLVLLHIKLIIHIMFLIYNIYIPCNMITMNILYLIIIMHIIPFILIEYILRFDSFNVIIFLAFLI
ncbi:hypothetical protein SAMN02910384_03206 [Pseudobutyrivibrio sp. ACV-2]|nr:hypothetical protein SAMN02910384_03206 [Pseudobutyrivibrio sp. ACV-2]